MHWQILLQMRALDKLNIKIFYDFDIDNFIETFLLVHNLKSAIPTMVKFKDHTNISLYIIKKTVTYGLN